MKKPQDETISCFYKELYDTLDESMNIIELQLLYDVLNDAWMKRLTLKRLSTKDRVIDKTLNIVHAILVREGVFKSTPLVEHSVLLEKEN